MHKFMRTIGFGGCDSDLEMDKIMRKLAKTASKTAVLERNDHPTLYDRGRNWHREWELP